MKKKFMVGIIILILILTLVFIKIKVVVKPNTDYVAMIYHSEMVGIDAGVEYTYYIYPNKNNTYLYIKSKSFITIEGSSEQKNVESGKIKEKSDFDKIKKSINMDKSKSIERHITYFYIQNGERKEYTSIEELGDKLF